MEFSNKIANKNHFIKSPGMTELYGVKLLDDLIFLEMKGILSAHLPGDASTKAARFKYTADSQRKILGELMVRAILASKHHLPNEKIHFVYSENSKPELQFVDNIHFNISHSGDWVVCAFSKMPVGVDVEKIKKVNFNIARRFFSDEEVNQLFALAPNEQSSFFFDLWTIKESYLKAIGTGLTQSLSSFSVRFCENDIHLMENENRIPVFIKNFQLDQKHKMSVCSFEGTFEEEFHQLYIDDLLNWI